MVVQWLLKSLETHMIVQWLLKSLKTQGYSIMLNKNTWGVKKVRGQSEATL